MVRITFQLTIILEVWLLHPRQMGKDEIEAFLNKNVAASTQNQALNAIVFLYKVVLEMPLDFPLENIRARRPKHLPTVLTREEVAQVLDCLTGRYRLMTQLLYGGGLRLSECLRLQVKDLDFGQHAIIVHDGKGGRDRSTILPEKLVLPLRRELSRTKRIHEQDLNDDNGLVYLPQALERKYPLAAGEWIWQFIFPPPRFSIDPRTGILRRHPPARERPRHQNRPGSARAQGCQNHDDLHPRAQARPIRSAKPTRLSP